MSGSARIHTIDAVALLALALRKFGEETGAALIDLELEVNRALEWIQHERRDYWENQTRLAWERIDEARAELDRCLRNVVPGQRPSCYEEKKALERAKRRLRTAEEKAEAVRRWSHTADRESLHFRVASGQLSGWLQAEAPQAIAVLKRMETALENYVSGPAPAGGSSAGEIAAGEAVTGAPGEAAQAGFSPPEGDTPP